MSLEVVGEAGEGREICSWDHGGKGVLFPGGGVNLERL